MDTKYLIKLVANSYTIGRPMQLITTIPRRMLRTQSMDTIKQHLANQYNLPREQIATIEPFYS